MRPLQAATPRVLLALLFVLLGVLGTLQYRWADELSAAERVRTRAGAQARADAFARDFDRELTRIVLRLSLDADAIGGRDYTAFAARFDAWRRSTTHPGLVGRVFLAELDADGARRLSAFDASARTFVPAEWPDELQGVRERTGAWGRGSQPPEPRPERPGPITLLPDGTPALVVPVLSLAQGHARGLAGVAGALRSPASLVIVLDATEIRERFLPALAERHFGGPDGLEYGLAVVRSDEPVEVWRTGAADAAHADASTGLLELRPEEANEEDLRELFRPRSATVAAPGPPGPVEPRGFTGWAFAHRGEPGAGRGGAHRPGRWRLIATHRLGSLDAVVDAARRRNLTVGFGMLLLLGASGALLVTSARRAERLARRQIEFVAGVTHELRTPLAVIRSAGENLADGVVRAPDEVRAYGSLVRDEGRRLSEMVEQALALAGAESGRQSAARAPVDVGPLLQQALRECQAQAPRAVVAEQDLAPDLPPVLGDADAMRRALRNLLDNAVKYGGDEGWVGVRTRLTAGQHGPEVSVVVEDHGLGVPPDERAHIFEPFYRGREATARQIRGSGLGLSLVRRIVESHGGRVSVEAGRQGGSAFTVTFPATSIATAEVSPS